MIIRKISNINPSNKIILSNFSYLSLLRFFNIGIKFLLVGYLVRVLGEFGYGQITWIESITQYFIILINFGFNIYASKRVVDSRNNKAKLNEIVSSIYIIKIFLFLISFVLLSLLMFNNKINALSSFFFIYLLTGIGEVFYPVWFFQGMEKMRPATIVMFFSRISILILTFLFVKESSDTYIYLWILVLSGVILAVLSLYMLKSIFQITFIKVSLKNLRKILNESQLFFWGRVMNLAFNSVTIFIIGYMFTMENVTIFDVSSKLIMVALIPFEMFNQAVFPTITRTLDKTLLKKVIIYTFVLSLILLVFYNVFADELLKLMGGNRLLEHTDVLRALSILIPIIALTFSFGGISLVAFNFEKEYNYSLIYSTLFFFIMLAIAQITDSITFWNLILLRITSDLVMLLIRVYYSYKLIF